MNLAGNGGTEGDGETSREKRFLQHLDGSLAIDDRRVRTPGMEQRIETRHGPSGIAQIRGDVKGGVGLFDVRRLY